jgi:hypothetical protein
MLETSRVSDLHKCSWSVADMRVRDEDQILFNIWFCPQPRRGGATRAVARHRHGYDFAVVGKGPDLISRLGNFLILAE